MRFMRGGVPAVILLVLGWTSNASATTVLNVPGLEGYYDFVGGALADSWTQNFSLTDGSISVRVQGALNASATTRFYITTQIGPNATLSDLVAFTSIDLPINEVVTVTPFSNLNLAPGTYYLVLADYNLPYNKYDYSAWIYNLASTVETAPGLVINPMYGTGSLGTFAPASTFVESSLAIDGVMSLSGTVVQATPTPEPSSVLLLGLALAIFGIARRKFRPMATLD